jgi:hypothetical protein
MPCIYGEAHRSDAQVARSAVSDSGQLFDSDHARGRTKDRWRWRRDWQISCCRNARPLVCNLAARRIIRSSMPDSEYFAFRPEIDRP